MKLLDKKVIIIAVIFCAAISFTVRLSNSYAASQAESDYQNDTQLDDELDSDTQNSILQNEQIGAGQISDTDPEILSVKTTVLEDEKQEPSNILYPEETVISIKPEIQRDQTTDEVDQFQNASNDTAQSESDAQTLDDGQN